MKRVLIVEDDQELVDLLKLHISDMGCHVDSRTDGTAGLAAALSAEYDLYLLDVMLPGVDGLEICRKIRSKEIQSPILMLTAKSEEIDKVLGLEMGADDYLTKPFSVRELLARLKALFRRSEMQTARPVVQGQSVLDFGRLSIDLDKHKTTMDGKRIELSPKEFELLALLAGTPGKSYNRSQILNLIWGYDFDGYEHTVNSHINRLRSKIEPSMQEPTYILTTWGVGYRFNEDLVYTS